VFPEERAALFDVAGRAETGDRVADAQHLRVRAAVRVVAARALHLALAHGHVAGAVKLRDLVTMTVRAELHLRLGLELADVRDGVVHAVA